MCRNRTSSTVHHRSRKHIAVSFSSKNLEYTQSVIKNCLQKFGSILSQKAKNTQSFMLDNDMIRLTLDIISESAFGINFNTMVRSDDNMGEFYMHENELFLKEAAKTMLNPLRKFMFWSSDRRRALQAKERVLELAHNLIKSHRQKHMLENGDVNEDDMSIMGRLMSYEYESEDCRAHDILMMLLGGHGEGVRRLAANVTVFFCLVSYPVYSTAPISIYH